jgi:inhibitor of cysteine peptidase
VSELVLTEEAANNSFDLYVGEPVVIRLQENPTTGYVWNIDQLDENVVNVEASDFSQSPGGGRVGAGGVRTIRLRPKAAGVTHVSLTNRRPWEGDAAPVRQFEVTLRIAQ